jgi:uncharacterized membrane protein
MPAGKIICMQIKKNRRDKIPGRNSGGEDVIGAGQTVAAPSSVKKNIETIMALEKESISNRSKAEIIADRTIRFAGNAVVIFIHVLWFTGWILVNCGLVPGIPVFDPYPFSFLTLTVSLEAIFLSLMVLMSQNRMTKEADKRAHLDLQINLLDEQETTMILRMVQKIGKRLGIEDDADDTVKELFEETDINRLAQSIEEHKEE